MPHIVEPNTPCTVSRSAEHWQRLYVGCCLCVLICFARLLLFCSFTLNRPRLARQNYLRNHADFEEFTHDDSRVLAAADRRKCCSHEFCRQMFGEWYGCPTQRERSLERVALQQCCKQQAPAASKALVRRVITFNRDDPMFGYRVVVETVACGSDHLPLSQPALP